MASHATVSFGIPEVRPATRLRALLRRERGTLWTAVIYSVAIALRSEEHTSELQSH